jgi:hypothetical protein
VRAGEGVADGAEVFFVLRLGDNPSPSPYNAPLFSEGIRDG